MKKILNTAILIIFSVLALLSRAEAVVLDKENLKEQIKQSIEKQIKSNTQVNGRIQVQSITLPYGKIEIEGVKSEDVKLETKMNLKYFNPLTIIRVNLLVNGEIKKSFTSQAKISVYDNVWIAKDFINRGEELTDVAYEEIDVTYISKVITDRNFNPYKYLAKKNYRTGEAINMTFIEPAPDIVKNSMVFIVFQTDTVSVTIPGIALNKGNIGDYIKVRSKDFRKDYQGKIINESQILVNI